MSSKDDTASESERHSLSRRGLLGAAGVLAGTAATGAGAQTREASPPSRRFADRVAVITGGARGMGRAHAVALAREGARIVVCDILDQIDTVDYPLATQADMDETARLVRAAGGEFTGIKGDVRDSGTAKTLIETALAQYGRVDFLIANAGVFDAVGVAKMSDAEFDAVIRTNLFGVFYAMRAAVTPMIRQGYGRIVATSSVTGRFGLANSAHYSASKWAVIGLAKSLAMEVAGQGITVNCVCPTSVNTPLVNNPVAWKRALPDDPNPTREKFEAKQKASPSLPQGVPWVEADDVANAVLFLLSDEARHISGSALDVSAGSAASFMS